jgi:hypothetical protein
VAADRPPRLPPGCNTGTLRALGPPTPASPLIRVFAEESLRGRFPAALEARPFDLSRWAIRFVALQEARDWIPRAAKTRAAAPRTKSSAKKRLRCLPAAMPAFPGPRRPLARAARFA